MYKTKRRVDNKKYSQRRKANYKKFRAPKGSVDVSKYTNKNVQGKDTEMYQNQYHFDDFNLNRELSKRIAGKGYSKPTEIQDKGIPYILMGDDLVGIAGTGTGKTAAFLIPIIDRMLEQKNNYDTLVIAPTRELATQIMDEFVSLTKGMGLYATALIGGTSVDKTIKSLRRTNHMIVGTPGRLMDMIKRKKLPIMNFQTLVLDEFDRMLDMGFKEDVLAIEKMMVNKRQTLLFSATDEPSQRSIIQGITYDPVKVVAKSGSRDSSSIEQDVIHVSKGENKIELIQALIKEQETNKVILFCETKQRVDAVNKKLRNENFSSDIIHGDKSQRERDKALRKFKKGSTNVLVATDVLARGIDVDDVALVINYEVPRNYTDYIHRIGRTGRAGKTGKAITFIDR